MYRVFWHFIDTFLQILFLLILPEYSQNTKVQVRTQPCQPGESSRVLVPVWSSSHLVPRDVVELRKIIRVRPKLLINISHVWGIPFARTNKEKERKEKKKRKRKEEKVNERGRGQERVCHLHFFPSQIFLSLIAGSSSISHPTLSGHPLRPLLSLLLHSRKFNHFAELPWLQASPDLGEFVENLKRVQRGGEKNQREKKKERKKKKRRKERCLVIGVGRM